MKSLSDRSFFLLFERIIHRDNPNLAHDSWKAHGVCWERMRHNFSELRYGYGFDVYIGAHSGRDAWSLLVVKEHWWAGRHGDAVKSQYWAKPLSGKRAVIMAWLKEQKRLLET